jgi:hypothetical protein
MVATAMGLAVVVILERESRGGVRWWVWSMVAAFALAFTVGLLLPPLRAFFEVSLPTTAAWLTTGLIAAAAISVLVAGRRRQTAGRRPDVPLPT